MTITGNHRALRKLWRAQCTFGDPSVAPSRPCVVVRILPDLLAPHSLHKNGKTHPMTCCVERVELGKAASSVLPDIFEAFAFAEAVARRLRQEVFVVGLEAQKARIRKLPPQNLDPDDD